MMAGATTRIAGILHLVLALNGISRSLPAFTIFFIVAGTAKLFWVISLIKRWGRIWYYMGIGGTIVLMILYALTRLPSPITEGRVLTINGLQNYSRRHL